MSHEKIDLYKSLFPAFKYALHRQFDISVEGAENVPDMPAIYTPNHIKFADSALVAMAYTEITGLPLRFAAKQEYFDGLGIDNKGKWGRSMKFLMEHTRMIPVDRESVDMDALMFDSSRALQRGDSIALHPEGTRSEDGKIHRFRPGAAQIAIVNSVPVVPTGLVYSKQSNERKTQVRIIFGDALLPSEFAVPHRTDRRQALLFTQAIENSVAELTDMEQTGVVAKLRKLRPLGETERE